MIIIQAPEVHTSMERHTDNEISDANIQQVSVQSTDQHFNA